MEELIYKCAVCNKEHNSIEARVECETKCLIERKKAEEAKKRDEYEMNKTKSAQEISNALSNVNEMIEKHFEKYDKLSLSDSYYPYLHYIFRSTMWF